MPSVTGSLVVLRPRLIGRIVLRKCLTSVGNCARPLAKPAWHRFPNLEWRKQRIMMFTV